MRKILIFGGAGYIGTVLSNHLLNQGFRVRSFDNFLYGNNHVILPSLIDPNYEHVYGDVCLDKDIDRAFDGVTDVVLLAGLVGDPITKKYPKQSKIVNETGVRNVIDRAHGKNLDKFIFVSTCSNYGLIEEDALADETFPLKPLSTYAAAKVKVEQHLISLDRSTDFQPTILRFATAFGLSPRMRFDLTISEFTRTLALGNELLVYDPDTWRPYCHVKDFSRLIETVLIADRKKVANQIFNAGGDINNYTKKMVVDEIVKILPDSKIKYLEKGTDPRNYKVDFTKVQQLLDFTPMYSVSDGVSELLDAIADRVFDRVDIDVNFYGNYQTDYGK